MPKCAGCFPAAPWNDFHTGMSTHLPDRPESRAGTAVCPVCRASRTLPFCIANGRDYWRCGTCGATFLDPRRRPDAAEEYAHYLHHENDPDDDGYRLFLARLAGPLIERLKPRRRGLDYGCGPGPALAAMLREAGHDVALYDPFFRPDRQALARTYDFISCTETAEHFHRPAEEFDRLDRLLRPGGWLGVMTCFQTDDSRFADWHYVRDPTHVVFYRKETFRHIAAMRRWVCEFPAKDVVLLRKPALERSAA